MPRPTLTTDPSPDDFAVRGRAEPLPGDGLALTQAFTVLRRAWVWILVPTLLAAVAAIAFVQAVAPRYTGEAKVLLESRTSSFARTAAERGEQPLLIDEQAVASQAQVALSRDIAREAIRQLKLVGNPEFDPEVGGPSPVQRALMLAGLAANPSDRPAEDRVLEAYFDHLLVYPAGKSRILSVEFRSKSAALAAEAANTVAKLYIASLEAEKVDTARYASTWLGSNIDALRARVAEAEAKVEAYRAKNGLIGTGGTQPLGSQQLGELSSQLSQARTIKADLTARAALLKEMIKDGRAFEIPDVANNELIRRSVESRMQLRAQLALESRTLLPAHPRIKELTAQLSDLEAQIKAAAERIVRTLENDARIAGARVESLQATVDGQRDVVAKGNTSEVQLRALEREAKVQREQLESYLGRYREAAARDAESATPADARIVSRAVVPDTPSFPKKLPIVGFASVLAFLLASALILGRHLLSAPPAAPRIEHDPDHARSEPDFPLTTDRERIAYPEPLPPETRTFAPSPLHAAVGTPVSPGSAALAAGETRSALAPFEPRTAAAKPEGSAQGEESAYEYLPLIERLQDVPSAAQAGHSGRNILVIDTTTDRADSGLAPGLARALCDLGSTVVIDIDGTAPRPGNPGLTDLVAGDATFPDVIQPVPGSRVHRVGRGFVDLDVLVEEPQGLAIGLQALAEAYEWVVCRIAAGAGDARHGLLSTMAGCMDTVVIASSGPANDAALIALYRLAENAGAGQVLVARSPVADAAVIPEMELRLSA